MNTTIARRSLLGAGTALLAAGRRARAQSPVTLTLAVWAAQAEEDAFRAMIARYQQKNPGVVVKLVVTGGSPQLYQQIDTQLAGHQAPDLFRCQYQQIGRYAAARAVVDLTSRLDPGTAEAFGPAFWQAVSYKGRVVALPHQTDTFACYYNKDMLARTGMTAPSSLAESWSWSDFIKAARAMKEKAGAPYGFAMAWQGGTAYRSLPFVYQHGATLLNADFSKPVLAEPRGIEAVAWMQSWFKDGLVPPNTSIKSTEPTQNLFANGTIGMLLGGNWQIPFLSSTMKAEWGVTYMPRDVAMASDLGGNCIAMTRDCKDQDAAADLLKFMTDEAEMRAFVVAAQFLPVRKTLMTQALPYKLRPDAMKVYVEQATTIPSHLVSTVTLPSFSKINAKMVDEMDLCFTSGQDPASTARNIDAQVAPLLAA